MLRLFFFRGRYWEPNSTESPPSIAIAWPVTKLLSSEASQRIALAMSSGRLQAGCHCADAPLHLPPLDRGEIAEHDARAFCNKTLEGGQPYA
jgi:hypothetical protein